MASYWAKVVLVALTLAATGLAASPATAQQAIDLKPGKAWKHRHSGIGVPATLAGTAREGGKAFATDDLDVGLSFVEGNAVQSLTFYIYRNTNGAVPVWFSQAQWGIENRDTFGHPALAIPPQAFVPPGQTTASGLKAIYEPKGGSYRSTGVMLLPVGDWYVKVRASSQTRSPAELASWMEAALAEIDWPRDIPPAVAAEPVTPCVEPLRFATKSADATGDDLTAEALGVALMSAAAGDETIRKTRSSAPPARWCRDRTLDGNVATYRPDGSKDTYLLAYGDNGKGLWIGPSPMKVAMDEIAHKKGAAVVVHYNVTLHTAAQDINFVLQDLLPSPERAIELVNTNRRASTVDTWGKNRQVQITSPAK